MKINTINNHYYNTRSEKFKNNKSQQNTNLNNANTNTQTFSIQQNSSPVSFQGFFSNLIYPYRYNLETKLDYEEIFKEIEKTTPNLRTLMKNQISTANLLASKRNFDSMNIFAQNIYPAAYIDKITDDLVSINSLTSRPDSYISYKTHGVYSPEQKKQIAVKLPEKLVVGESKEMGGGIDEIYDFEEKVVMKKIKSNFADPIRAQRVEILDVAECSLPAFKFLQKMDCDNAILNNVRMGSDGKIQASSILTYKEDSDGKIKVKDVYMNPTISQARVHSSQNGNEEADWRIIVNADEKFSSIDNAKYTSYQDYGERSIIQRKVKEIYEPKEDKWYGRNDYTIIPNRIIKNGKVDYTCKVACRTKDGEVTNWLKSKIMAA